LQLYLSRNPNSQFRTRQDIANSPEILKSIPPPKVAQWKTPFPAPDLAGYARLVKAREQLMINVAKVIADNKLDAIVYKTVEYPPLLIKDGMNPPYLTGNN